MTPNPYRTALGIVGLVSFGLAAVIALIAASARGQDGLPLPWAEAGFGSAGILLSIGILFGALWLLASALTYEVRAVEPAVEAVPAEVESA